MSQTTSELWLLSRELCPYYKSKRLKYVSCVQVQIHLDKFQSHRSICGRELKECGVCFKRVWTGVASVRSFHTTAHPDNEERFRSASRELHTSRFIIIFLQCRTLFHSIFCRFASAVLQCLWLGWLSTNRTSVQIDWCHARTVNFIFKQSFYMRMR